MSKFNDQLTANQNIDPFFENENEPSEFETLLEQSQMDAVSKRYKFGENVKGRVLSVGNEYVFLDLGGKNTGILSVGEFENSSLSIPKKGETITAFVKMDNGSEVILTRSVNRDSVDTTQLREAFENSIPVEAKIEKVIKGGFQAQIGALRCFVPLGQMDIVAFDDPAVYVGSVFKFHVIECTGRNVVLSRKLLLKEEQDILQAQTLEKLEVGQNYVGTISRIKDFGAFVSVDGVDGLLPISELSWGKVKKVEDIVKMGEKVSVKLIKFERTPRLRLTFSLKSASDYGLPVESENNQGVPAHKNDPKPVFSSEGGVMASAFKNARVRK